MNRVPLLNYNDDNYNDINSIKKKTVIERKKDEDLLNVLNLACKNLHKEVSLNAGLLLEQQLYLKAKVFGTNSPSIITFSTSL